MGKWKEVEDSKKKPEKNLDRYPEKNDYREVSEREKVEAILQRKKDAHDRTLNTPRLEGFENLGKKEQKEIKDYLASELPDKHLNDINISRMKYHDTPKLNERGDKVLGQWTESDKGYNIREGSIDVYNQGNDVKQAKETISHETGHDVFFRLDSDKQAKWDEISGKRNGDDCVTYYATKDKHEDFAESYRFYINHSNELKHINKDKHTFMKDEVFEQRSYDT